MRTLLSVIVLSLFMCNTSEAMWGRRQLGVNQTQPTQGQSLVTPTKDPTPAAADKNEVKVDVPSVKVDVKENDRRGDKVEIRGKVETPQPQVRGEVRGQILAPGQRERLEYQERNRQNRSEDYRPRVTVNIEEHRRNDRENGWRYTQRNGQWWYYTPNNNWLILKGNAWVDYVEPRTVVVPQLQLRTTGPAYYEDSQGFYQIINNQKVYDPQVRRLKPGSIIQEIAPE